MLGCWIFVGTFEGILISFVSFFINILNVGNLLKCLSISSIWILLEWVQSLGPLGFSWFRLAIPLTNFPFLLQITSVFGSLIASFIIVLINCFLTLIIINKNNNYYLKSMYKSLAFLLTFFLLSNYICSLLGNNCTGSINFSIIQGNISSYNKIGERFVKDNLDTYINLTEKSMKELHSIDLVLWPETAVPIYLNRNKEVYNLYKNIAIENKTNFIVGAFTLADNKKYNALFCFNPDGNLSSAYRKGQLVPLGEFIPFSELIFKAFPYLKDFEAFSDNLKRDMSTPTLNASFGDLGAYICFEAAFPDIPRSEISKGAKIFCQATNDSWFKDSKQLDQHLHHSVLRAIELNRYILISANTGISAAINNRGKILKIVPKESMGYITGEAKLFDYITPYSYWGDIPIIGLSIILIGISLIKTISFKNKEH